MAGSEPPDASMSPLAEVRRIAVEVARPAAVEVDRDARFPREAIAALRADRLLAAAIPRDLRGLGCSVAEVSAMCEALGRSCASTAMIFAMHQIQIFCLARHGATLPFFRDYLQEAASRQWLVASGTSEVAIGGDLRSSNAAVERTGTRFRLEKLCSVLSYGEEADAILLTARRAPDAARGDQVLALARKQDYRLERIGTWDTLGMRGTCSPPFRVTAEAAVEQLLPEPFRSVASLSMVPYSHIVWAAVWLGIAGDAVSTARALVSEEARKRPGAMPFGAARLAGAAADLQLMKASVRAEAAEYDRLSGRAEGTLELSSLAYALRINNLKLTASRLVVQICQDCMVIGGIAAYTNGSELGLGRHVRDALGAPLMIADDRILATNAGLLLLPRGDEG